MANEIGWTIGDVMGLGRVGLIGSGIDVSAKNLAKKI